MSATRRWIVVVATIVVIGLLTAAGVIVARQRHLLHHTRIEVSAAVASRSVSDQRAANLDGDLGRARGQVRSLQRTVAHDRHRLDDPSHGKVPRRTWASLHGELDRLAPDRATVTGVRAIRPVAGRPAQLVVTWRGPAGRFGGPDVGFLLWTAHPNVTPSPGGVEGYRHWRVTYDWHLNWTPRQAHVGVPGHERVVHNPIGQSYDFSVGDATGDGTPEVLVSFDSDGSGDCRQWQLLSTVNGRTHRILARQTCDGGLSIHHGMVEITRAVHGPRCSIHGCGPVHRTLLRRVGTGWVVASRGVVGHRDTLLDKPARSRRG